MRVIPWLLAACLLAVGCGGAATAATERPEYETIVTEELDEIADPLAALQGADEYDALVERLREGEERANDAAERLRAIEPPHDLHDENAALIAALRVLAEDFHRVAETLTTLQEDGMPPEYPPLLETLGAIHFDSVEMLQDALMALRNAGVEV